MVFVEEINRNRPDFYQLMGRFFGSRSVAAEVGINIYDDHDKRWFVAFDGGLVGFASLRKALISDCYVLPEKRNQKVFTCILRSIQVCSKGKLKANCTEASKKAFINAGFLEVRKTKNFTFMEYKNA
jgi:hypothetical protein